jgi:hypothetical protein
MRWRNDFDRSGVIARQTLCDHCAIERQVANDN